MSTFPCLSCGRSIATADAEPGDQVTCPFCLKRFVVPTETNWPDTSEVGDDEPSAATARRSSKRNGSQPPAPWFQIALAFEILVAVCVVFWPIATILAVASDRSTVRTPELPKMNSVIFAAFLYWLFLVWVLIDFMARGIVAGWITNDSRKRMSGAGAAWAIITITFGVWTFYVYRRYRDH